MRRLNRTVFRVGRRLKPANIAEEVPDRSEADVRLQEDKRDALTSQSSAERGTRKARNTAPKAAVRANPDTAVTATVPHHHLGFPLDPLASWFFPVSKEG
jgi:hypothetical protein